MITFEQLSDPTDYKNSPWLDKEISINSLKFLPPYQHHWYHNGFIILKDFIPENLINPYVKLRAPMGNKGWPDCIPYMRHSEIRDLCLYGKLVQVLNALIGAEMGLHLNLTNWVSTERNWHQDDYLNPGFINGWYLAVWIALDDIDQDSGVFQYVPGSHKWGRTLTSEKVRQFLSEGVDKNNPDWPKISEDYVHTACEQEIELNGGKIMDFVPDKGDILIWHSRLMHRGSKPINPDLQRKSIIAHYSALKKRKDMPNRKQHSSGGWYFEF
jgi:hypothetical protein